jgi:hypothetical protein
MKTFVIYLADLLSRRPTQLIFIITFFYTAGAFPHDNNKLELKGFVTNVGEFSLDVDGLTLNVTEETEIKDEDGNHIVLSDLMVGDFVETKSNLSPEGMFIASEIKIDDEGEQESELEIKADIEAIDSSSIWVSGIQLFVDDNTQIKRDDETIEFEELMIGDNVEVDAEFIPNTYFLADKIKVEEEGNHDEDFETEGLITELGDSTLTVNGFLFAVNEFTKIKDDDDIISFYDLNVGDFVEVEAVFLPDSSLLATEIEREDDHENKIEFDGMIESIDSTNMNLVVSGTLVYTNDETEIFGEDHEPFSFNDLTVGMFVEVKAILQPDSTLLATKIKVEDDDDNEIEFEGTIESIDSTNFSLVVNSIIVFVNDDTEIFSEDHEPISFNDLMVGMFVEVKAMLQPDSTLLALKIEIEDGERQRINIKATIDTLYSNTLVVGGITFETDSNTVILDNDKNPITFEDLEIGMFVKVKGTLISPGVYLATKIRIRDFWHRSIDMSGEISDVSSVKAKIGNVEFYFTPETIFLDELGNLVDNTYLNNGMLVNVRTVKNIQGMEDVVRIKVQHQSEFEFEGLVNQVIGNLVTIGNQTIELQDYTFITYVNDEEVTAQELQVGDYVTSQFISQSNQSNKASYITISNSPDIIKSTGVVTEITTEHIVISQPVYQVNSSTVILNSNFDLIDYNSINVGDVVTIWAKNSNSGNPMALQIQIPMNGTTGVNGNGLVTEYSLLQNFPNPFNPSTTIRFTIPERAFVTLKVYNILGEVAANLVNENLNQGTYSINFDASNLPSGVYLYKIEANDFLQVNKMLLVK